MPQAEVTKTVNLYRDEITIHFSEKARNRYVVEETGHSPVGVTSVLQKVIAKEALMTWPMNEALKFLIDLVERDELVDMQAIETSRKAYLRKSDDGKEAGTLIHKAIEQFLTTNMIAKTARTEKALKSFIDWWTEQNPRLIAAEQIVYSREHDYCGMFDSLLEIDGEMVLCDVKTTNSSRTAPEGVYPEMFLQLGGYSLALGEEFKKSVNDLMIIRVSKEGGVNTMRASQLGLSVRSCENAWLNALGCYRFLVPLAKELSKCK